MAEPSATPTVLTDNDRVRVTRWVFAAGEATGHHRHAYDYVVVPQSDGTLLIRSADGEQTAELRRDAPLWCLKTPSLAGSVRNRPGEKFDASQTPDVLNGNTLVMTAQVRTGPPRKG